MLRLDYAPSEYRHIDLECPYSFEVNQSAVITKKAGCDINIGYPEMKATLYLTYRKVENNNLDSLLRDAQKLAYNHTIKANSIPEQPYVNPDDDVFGMLYMINGDAATQAGFYLTDSINHFLNGARSEEHTSELQSRPHLVCRLLLEKKKKKTKKKNQTQKTNNR